MFRRCIISRFVPLRPTDNKLGWNATHGASCLWSLQLEGSLPTVRSTCSKPPKASSHQDNLDGLLQRPSAGIGAVFGQRAQESGALVHLSGPQTNCPRSFFPPSTYTSSPRPPPWTTSISTETPTICRALTSPPLPYIQGT